MPKEPINPIRETPYTMELTRNEMVCLVKYHTSQAKAIPKKVGVISMKLADSNRGIPRRRDLASLHAEATDVLQYHTARARGILSIIQPKKGERRAHRPPIMKTSPPQQTPSGGSMRRLVRVPWTADEDAEIKGSYGGDWIVTYPMLADRLNSKFHGGKPVRSARSVERRELKLESDANDALCESAGRKKTHELGRDVAAPSDSQQQMAMPPSVGNAHNNTENQ